MSIWLQNVVKESIEVGEIVLDSGVLFILFCYGRLPHNYFILLKVNVPKSSSYKYGTLSTGVYTTKYMSRSQKDRRRLFSSITYIVKLCIGNDRSISIH